MNCYKKKSAVVLRWVVVLFFSLLFTGSLYALERDNLIKNPGFEEVNVQGKPESWSLNPQSGSDLLLDKNTYSILPIGKGNVVRTFSRKGNNWSALSQGGIKVEGNKEYLFSLAYRTSRDFTHNLYVVVREYDRDGKHIEKRNKDYLSTGISPSSNWTTWRKRFRTQPKTTTISISIYPLGAGTAWFDNFSLVKFKQSTEELKEKLRTYYEENFHKKGNWETKNIIFTLGDKGARIATLKNYGYLKGYIPYDKLHPYLQMRINEVEKGAKWMLVNLGEGMERISSPSDKTGLFTYDLGKMPGLPEKGQLLLGIYVLGEGKSVTIAGIRTLSREIAERGKWQVKRTPALKIGFIADPADISKWKSTSARIKIQDNACRIIENSPGAPYGRLDSPLLSLNIDEYPYLTISLKQDTGEKYGWSLALDNKIPLSIQQYTNRQGVITYDLREKANWKGKKNFFLSFYVVGKGKYVDINWIKIANQPIKSRYELKGKDAARGYVLYVRKPFAVLTYNTLPEKDEINKKVSIFASPGEYEPATFLIYAARNLKEVKVTIGNLKNKNGKVIPGEDIDIRVVKVWYQAGTGNKIGEPVFVPELLLKDDALIASDHVKKRNILYFKGLPLDGPGLKPVDIPANSSKEFWLTIKVPKDAPAGIYTSKIKVTAANASADELDLEVRVLPIKLREPEKIYGMYYSPGIVTDENRSIILKQLIDMRAHGLNSPCDYSFHTILKKVDGKWKLDLAPFKKEMDLWVKAGFTKPMLLAFNTYDSYFPRRLWTGTGTSGDEKLLTYIIKALERCREENNYPEILYYGIDEPAYDPTGKALERSGKLFEIIRKAGGKTTTAITLAGANKLGSLIDVPIYDEPSANRIFQDPGLKNKNKIELHYWHPLENPNVDRLRFGLLVWKSGLDGAYPFAYRAVFSHDPYDDFGKKGNLRNEMYTYPSKEGPIPTIQWEAVREGIDDVRYLTTLSYLVKKSQAIKGNEALDKEIKKGIRLLKSLPGAFNGNVNLLYKDLKPEDFQDYRWQVAEQIIRLQELLKKQGSVR